MVHYTYDDIRKNPEVLDRFTNEVPIACTRCGARSLRQKRNVTFSALVDKSINRCEKFECNIIAEKGVIMNCPTCDNPVRKTIGEIKKNRSGRIFCNQSCAATYNNRHRKLGYRRSKLEAWIEKKLIERYDFLIEFNSKSAIGSELDIYIPSLKLGIELNGIFHYEPIYGNSKLEQIVKNDQNKFASCIEKGISLCVVDTSAHKYVKESTSQKYVDIVVMIIEDAISAKRCE